MRCRGKKFELFSPSLCCCPLPPGYSDENEEKTNFPLHGVLENYPTRDRVKKMKRKTFPLRFLLLIARRSMESVVIFRFSCSRNPWRPTLFVQFSSFSSHKIAASLHDNDEEEEKFWILLMLARMLQLRRFVVCSFAKILILPHSNRCLVLVDKLSLLLFAWKSAIQIELIH